MDRLLDVEAVAGPLPEPDGLLSDARLRPVGLVGGFLLVAAGVAVWLVGGAGFGTAAVAGAITFVGVPTLCLGLAAPEPDAEDAPFRIGVELSPEQRRAVAGGSLLLLLAPPVVLLLGLPTGFALPVWIVAGVLTLLGAVLVLVGFVAWSSAVLSRGGPPP